MDQGPTQLYRHFDANGKLLYIGISLSALHRLAGHKEHSHWFRDIARVEIETYPTRAEALKAERAAILAEQPLYNIRCRRDLKACDTEPRSKRAKASESDLVSRIVRFDIYYEESKLPLPLRRRQIREYMDSGALGYIELPNATNTKMKRYVTGWQLIDFIEWLERNFRHSLIPPEIAKQSAA